MTRQGEGGRAWPEQPIDPPDQAEEPMRRCVVCDAADAETDRRGDYYRCLDTGPLCRLCWLAYRIGAGEDDYGQLRMLHCVRCGEQPHECADVNRLDNTETWRCAKCGAERMEAGE
jgi:DNA-directed RNA polymerase subunit RPC12/RpoP